jgi:citrate lyase subunit beta / citryl-CoA lyase
VNDPRTATTWLFVPGDRRDRFAKAAATDADLVVLDLEDAVARPAKDEARAAVEAHLRTGAPAAVRINNDTGGEQRALDVALLTRLTRAGKAPAAIVVPRAADAASLQAVAAAAPEAVMVALVESAAGLLALPAIAAHAHRLALGHLDLAADVGCAVDAHLVQHARIQLVLHSRVAGLPAPIDGVTPDVRDEEAARRDATNARREGFGGKLCLHPNQVAVVRDAMRPSDAEIAWARRVVEALHGGGVGLVDGEMVDAPVLARAAAVLGHAR